MRSIFRPPRDFCDYKGDLAVSDRRIFNSHMKGNTNVRFEILQGKKMDLPLAIFIGTGTRR
jgi:hypothetical protein